MKKLIEDYERRLKTVMKEIAKGGNDLTINRLGTKASCYRTFLTELNKALTIHVVVGQSEQLHVGNYCKCEGKESFNRLQCPKCKPL